LFWREGALRGQAFDASRRTMSGDVFVVANDVFLDDNERPAASTAAGTLIYASGPVGSRSSLFIVDRSGKPLKTIAESVQTTGGMALSHDGLRLALPVMAPNAKDSNIWVYDLARETGRPVTLDPGDDYNPAWSPDDSEIAYTNVLKGDGRIFRRFSDGRGDSRQAVTYSSGAWPWEWSKDGKWILFGAQGSKTGVDVLRANLDGSPVTPLVSTVFADDTPSLSPDNRWLAYTSDETGTTEVYVRPLVGEGRWAISGSGGGAPLWRQDGRELYFVTPRSQVMAVSVDPTGPAFKFGVPVPLFRAEFDSWEVEHYFVPFADGQRFVVCVVPSRTNVLLTLVTNWRPPVAQK
jgi:Tol biopolymer transport system component